MTEHVRELKHRRIAAALAREITAGVHVPGGRLPGEQALASRFGASRNTLRAALALLTEQGLIETRAGLGSYVTFGRGSFVTFDHQPLDASLGWSRALGSPQAAVSTELLRLELVHDPELAAEVGLDSDELIAVDRVRRAGGTAVSYERSRVPALGALRELPARGLLGGSLTTSLRAAGLDACQGEECIELALLTRADAEVLGREPGAAFLHSRRITRDAAGRFVEQVDSLLDPQRFQLHLRFDGVPR